MRRSRPLLSRPLGIAPYDLCALLGVSAIANYAVHMVSDYAMSGVMFFPVMFFYWRRSDVKQIVRRTRQPMLAARSNAMLALEMLLLLGTVIQLFTIGTLTFRSLAVLYAGWTVVVVQYLRYRHRTVSLVPFARLAWWQRSEFMVGFGLIVWLVLIEADAEHLMELFSSATYIEALVR